MKTYDIAIIGAGPAGSNLARLLADKYRIILVDQRDIPAVKIEQHHLKCCGGLLAPDAQAMIAQMGLGIPRDIISGPQLFVVRAIDLPSGQERFYQRYYINLDRHKFDQWLLSLVSPREVDLKLGWRLRGGERRKELFHLKLKQGRKAASVTCRILVGADGANSAVRRFICPNIPLPKRYLAIQEAVEIPCPQPYFSAFFDSELTDYYGWISPSSAEGFSYALNTAVRLATAISYDFNSFTKYYQFLTKPLKRNIMIKSLKARLIYQPLCRQLLMRSGFKSLNIFDLPATDPGSTGSAGGHESAPSTQPSGSEVCAGLPRNPNR